MDNNARIHAINQALAHAFPDSRVTLRDDSHLHAGHTSHGGAGHFHVHILSDAFIGKSRVARHQMVFAALSALMGKDIHALGIHAQTWAEAE